MAGAEGKRRILADGAGAFWPRLAGALFEYRPDLPDAEANPIAGMPFSTVT